MLGTSSGAAASTSAISTSRRSVDARFKPQSAAIESSRASSAGLSFALTCTQVTVALRHSGAGPRRQSDPGSSSWYAALHRGRSGYGSDFSSLPFPFFPSRVASVLAVAVASAIVCSLRFVVVLVAGAECLERVEGIERDDLGEGDGPALLAAAGNEVGGLVV